MEPVRTRRVPRLVRSHVDADIGPRIPQVQRPGATLVPVTDDRDPLVVQGREVGVCIMENHRHGD